MLRLQEIKFNRLNNNKLLLFFHLSGAGSAEVIERLLPHDEYAELPEPIQFDPQRWYGIGDFSLAIRMPSTEPLMLEVMHNGEYAPAGINETDAFLRLPALLEQKQLIAAAERLILEQYICDSLLNLTAS